MALYPALFFFFFASPMLLVLLFSAIGNQVPLLYFFFLTLSRSAFWFSVSLVILLFQPYSLASREKAFEPKCDATDRQTD